MPNYWLGIMAVVLAITLAVWIGLVFRADKHQSGPSQDAAPSREVIGGVFAARQGGRQVMPDPEEPIIHDDWAEPAVSPSVPRQAAGAAGTAHTPEPARPAPTGLAARSAVPGQRAEPVPEQTPAPGDRR
jgi:hypothetical protein